MGRQRHAVAEGRPRSTDAEQAVIGADDALPAVYCLNGARHASVPPGTLTDKMSMAALHSEAHACGKHLAERKSSEGRRSGLSHFAQPWRHEWVAAGVPDLASNVLVMA